MNPLDLQGKRTLSGEGVRSAAWFAALQCRLFGHRWHVWEAGHVYAGDDWDGDRLSDGTPWAPGFRSCDRCGESVPL